MLTLLLVIGIILFVLWALGLITRRTMGGGVHILVVIAVILIILWLVFAIIIAIALRIDFLPFALSLSKGER